jgi:hypothetical protein
MAAPAEQLNSPDTVCLAVTGAVGNKTLAHPGRATVLNCLASITFVNGVVREKSITLPERQIRISPPLISRDFSGSIRAVRRLPRVFKNLL